MSVGEGEHTVVRLSIICVWEGEHTVVRFSIIYVEGTDILKATTETAWSSIGQKLPALT